MTPEKDPLLEELEERIYEGFLLYSRADEDFIEKLRKKKEHLTDL